MLRIKELLFDREQEFAYLWDFIQKGSKTMARITVEDCLEQVESRFELVQLVTKRAMQLRDGDRAVIDCNNKEIVTALREVAAGKVKHVEAPEYDSDEF